MLFTQSSIPPIIEIPAPFVEETIPIKLESKMLKNEYPEMIAFVKIVSLYSGFCN